MMPLSDEQELQLVRDVAEVKGLLTANLSAAFTRLDQHDAQFRESRAVHAQQSGQIGALTERLVAVEHTAREVAKDVAEATTTTRANIAMTIAGVAGLVGIAGLALNFLTVTA